MNKFDKFAERRKKLTTDKLQNELVLIDHHLTDIEKGITGKDYKYAIKGIKDAQEAVQRLKGFLPKPMGDELDRVSESMTSRQRRG